MKLSRQALKQWLVKNAPAEEGKRRVKPRAKTKVRC